MKKTFFIIALLLVSISVSSTTMKGTRGDSTSKLFDVQWTNFAYDSGEGGPDGGSTSYHTGNYPVWKNFTVHYLGDDPDGLAYISVKYPEATPAFKPDYYEIRTTPSSQDWTIRVNLADRQVDFAAKPDNGLTKGMWAIVSIRFIEGPTAEDCTVGQEFAVTVSENDPAGQTYYLKEYIDKTAPEISITFPDQPTKPAPGTTPYTFQKNNATGSIWVLMPNCTDRDVGWLWINGTASDSCSSIHRVEIWINGTYHGDATIIPKPNYNNVQWWWKVDPAKSDWWKTDTWYEVTARAYDKSVNDLILATTGPTLPGVLPHTNKPSTNNKDAKSYFFWIGIKSIVSVPEWIPGNGKLDINCTSFAPYSQVEITLENTIYNIKKQLTTVTADGNGRLKITIDRVPEVPRDPDGQHIWTVKAFSSKGNITGADRLEIIPWITYESSDSLNVWKTTKSGNVGDAINVYGHGFLPSRQSPWDPYSTVTVEIVFTDVAPLTEWDWRTVFNGTSQDDWDTLKWYPKLSEKILATITTDANGYWKAENLKIPSSFGGLHAIYAREVRLATDVGKPAPTTPYVLVVSGWPALTLIQAQAQAVIFDIWPTITVSPSPAITNQYVTLNGEGLPLPKHYQLQWRRDGEQHNWVTLQQSRDWCLVLDFGPNKEWVYENQRIRNNELDEAWLLESWYPFTFHTPDIKNYLDSPVWAGKLTSATIDFETDRLEFRVGSKYLKVPVLPPDKYDVTIYYFDKKTNATTRDHFAQTTVNVIKDPLNVQLQVGTFHLPGEIVHVFAQIDVDGIVADATITTDLYRGDKLVTSLNSSRVDAGSYVGSFTCPPETGDYFVKAKATIDYGPFKLYGSAIAGFTVNPTLNNINVKLVALESKVATLVTDVGQIRIDLAVINATVTGIEGKIATIESDIGTIKSDVTKINAAIASLQGDTATVKTDINTLSVKLQDLNSVIEIQDDVATIKTTLEEVKGKVISLEGSTATIQTDLGTITQKADVIQSSVGFTPITLGLSVLAAVTAIAAAILIMRKVYLK